MVHLRSLCSLIVTAVIAVATFSGLWFAIDPNELDGRPRMASCRRCGRLVRAGLCLALLLLVPRRAEAQVATSTTDHATLLKVAAESARDQRVREGTEALAYGVVFAGAGVASWVTPSEPSARETRDVIGGVLVGAGGLMVVGGSLALAFDCETPTSLEAAAKSVRTERIVSAVTSFVFSALELGGGIVLEATADDHGLKWLGRGLMASSAGSAILGFGSLAVRSEAERLADLERASSHAFHVRPQLGFGSVGLAGTF